MIELFNEKLSNPLVVFWELTRRCNLRCIHCYTHSERSGFQLSDKDLFSILEIIKGKNIFSLGLGGGEPLLVKSLLKIISAASSSGIDVSLSTNGYFLTYEKARQLKDAGLFLAQISIDGMKNSHENIRGDSSFGRAVRAVQNAKRAGLITRVAMTINQMNFWEVESVFNLALKLRADWFIAFRYMTGGRSGDKLSLNQNSLRFAAETLVNLHKKFPSKVFFEKLVFLPFLIDKNYRSQKSCNAGKSILNITANGDITPCPHLQFPVVANIFKSDIDEIWNSPNIEMNDCKADECQICQHKNICGGGCKGIISNNNNQKDPLCWA